MLEPRRIIFPAAELIVKLFTVLMPGLSIPLANPSGIPSFAIPELLPLSAPPARAITPPFVWMDAEASKEILPLIL